MNKELQSWCAEAQRELCAEPERNKTMIKLILLNPVSFLAYAFAALAIIFKLLGWEA